MSMFWYLYLRGFQSSNFTGYCVILQVASCFVCEFLSSWSLWCFCLIMGTWSSCHCNIQTSAPARIIHLRMALLYAVTLLFGMITSKSQPRLIPWLPMRNPSTSEGPAVSDKQESCAICSKIRHAIAMRVSHNELETWSCTSWVQGIYRRSWKTSRRHVISVWLANVWDKRPICPKGVCPWLTLEGRAIGVLQRPFCHCRHVSAYKRQATAHSFPPSAACSVSQTQVLQNDSTQSK